jgi:hypothetical protein
MRAIILGAVLALVSSASLADINQVTKYCLDAHGYDRTASIEERMKFDFSKASSCQLDYLADKRKEELAELRDFLKHNPRYRVPGQSLNRCWGKPREMPFEKSSISVGPNGMHAAVWYKDKMPAGCYENAPWDNRDKK